MKKILAGLIGILIAGNVLAQTTDTESPGSSPAVKGWNYLYNGTAWDRQRTNLSATAAVTALAAASTGANGADLVNFNGHGVKLTIDITVITGTTPTLTVTIQGKDAVSGKYYTILASTALNAVATTVLTVYPGIAASANVAASDVLPRDWRVIYAIAGTTPAVTATIGAAIIN